MNLDVEVTIVNHKTLFLGKVDAYPTNDGQPPLQNTFFMRPQPQRSYYPYHLPYNPQPYNYNPYNPTNYWYPPSINTKVIEPPPAKVPPSPVSVPAIPNYSGCGPSCSSACSSSLKCSKACGINVCIKRYLLGGIQKSRGQLGEELAK